MIKRKNGLRIICMILVFIQCFCIMAPNVEALGNLDFSSAMMTGLINDSGQNVALGINERRITLLDNQNKRVENFVLEVDLKSFPNTSIVTGSYKDGTGYGMTTVAEQAKAAIDNGKPVVAAVNADYYNMATGEPIGCFVKDGAVINELPSNRCYFGVRKDGTPVIGDYNSYMAERAQLQEAVGGLCKLVDKGVVIDYTGSDETYYTTKQPRTAVGIKADGSVVFMVSDGRQEPYSAGLTMYELGLLMKDLGCEIA
ncbi:MAG: hypothetical protein K0R50_3421, partial [Eubacterium sp.]|nr:hypothetical protein [Eubacterium sp.]